MTTKRGGGGGKGSVPLDGIKDAVLAAALRRINESHRKLERRVEALERGAGKGKM